MVRKESNQLKIRMLADSITCFSEKMYTRVPANRNNYFRRFILHTIAMAPRFPDIPDILFGNSIIC